jgi:hypothetical protein
VRAGEPVREGDESVRIGLRRLDRVAARARHDRERRKGDHVGRGALSWEGEKEGEETNLMRIRK